VAFATFVISPMTSVQVAVIGGGPGGYAAAYLASDLGLQALIVDTEVNPGGVCTWCGCIPSKALLHVAKLIDESRHSGAWGVTFAEPTIDLDKLRAWKNGVVTKLTSGNGSLAKMRKVIYLQGVAEIVDAHTLRVALVKGGTEDVRCEHLILATGSIPTRIPSLSIESPRVWDSTAALELRFIPKTLLVVGGGYIGLELGTVYAALGTSVTVVEMTDGLLPGVDRDLVNILARRVDTQMKGGVHLNTKVTRMTDEKNGVRVALETADGKSVEHTFDAVLVAIGRRPNSKVAGLDRTSVKIDARGFIQVDAQRRTAERNIFAIGDVAGEPMLAHKAMHEGRVAAEVIAGKRTSFEPRAIPAVVFTDPEIAWCGLTEAQAQKEGLRVQVARYPWGASGRAVTLDRTDGLTKLIVDAATERVLGVGFVGSGAGELIAEGVLAIEMGATATDVELSIHPHPTLTETMMESAEVIFGQATHIYRPIRK